jgi:hypothetical protein
MRSNLSLDHVWRAESAQGIKPPWYIVRIILDITEEGPQRDQLPFFGIGRKGKANFCLHPLSVSHRTKIPDVHVGHGSYIFSRKQARLLPRIGDFWMLFSQPATGSK